MERLRKRSESLFNKVMLSAGEERELKTWRPRFLRQGSYERIEMKRRNAHEGEVWGSDSLILIQLYFPRGEGIFVLF